MSHGLMKTLYFFHPVQNLERHPVCLKLLEDSQVSPNGCTRRIMESLTRTDFLM